MNVVVLAYVHVIVGDKTSLGIENIGTVSSGIYLNCLSIPYADVNVNRNVVPCSVLVLELSVELSSLLGTNLLVG